MKVLLLLAGQSKRFWPLQEKPLFPLCGKALLEHQVERLKQAGLTDIVLVGSGTNLELIRSFYPDLTCIEQEDPDGGMRAAMLSALPACGSEPVMVVGGNDVLEPAAYKDLHDASERNGVAGAILAQRVEKYFPGGYLEVDGDRITSVVEKPGAGNEPSDLVNIVAHVHNDPQSFLAALEATSTDEDDGYEQALHSLFASQTYHAVPYEGVWQAVKYPWHVLELLPVLLEEIVEQRIDPSAEIHPTAVITGNVVIEAGTRVMPHATVVGPCYIGQNCIVANNALARGSSIGDHCVVGYNTEVKGSVLHSHVWTHMTYIGDSVIGSNVSFGAGSVTGNLRLDEEPIPSAVKGEMIDSGLVKFGAVIGDNCRLGIQTAISPGVKIGGGTFVSSTAYVTEDVPDKQFVRMKEGVLKMSENRTAVAQPEAREKFRKKV